MLHELTQASLRELLLYDPMTGRFTWRVFRGGRLAGEDAGFARRRRTCAYVIVKLNYYPCLAHRLAWLYMMGAWPPAQIDHIDGDGLNNRWANLRLATISQNLQNSRLHRDSNSGFKGVSYHKASGLWRSRIGVSGSTRSLGYFSTAKEAHVAYCAAAKDHFGEFARLK